MKLGTAAALLLLSVAGIAASCICLRRQKTLRTVFVVLLSLLAAACAVYIGLTLMLVDAVSRRPPM